MEAIPKGAQYCIWCGSPTSDSESGEHGQNDRKERDPAGKGSVFLASVDEDFRVDFDEIPEDILRPALHKRQKLIPLPPLMARIAALQIRDSRRAPFSLRCLSEINVEPRSYQMEAATAILDSMNGSGILADEVGLGKTIEAGLVIKEMLVRQTASNVLILVPASLRTQWATELRDKFLIDTVDENSLDSFEDGLLLMSLHKAKTKRYQPRISEISWDLVVIDEAHMLKNHLTQAYKFVYSLKRKYTLLITATPIQNDLRELYNLINIVKPGYFKSIRLFRRKYMKDRFTPNNTEELRRLTSKVMVRHRRSDTLIKLPPRVVETVFVDPSPLEREFYELTLELGRRTMEAYSTEEGEHLVLLLNILLKESTSSPQALLSTLKTAVLPKVTASRDVYLIEKLLQIGRRLPMTAKMTRLLDIVEDAGDEPVIVYTEYLKTLEVLESLLRRAGRSVHVFAGHMRIKDKERALERFRTEGGILLSTEVGGQGLNLQHCHRLINFDFPWNPMKLEQRIGRVHRFGQESKVLITSIAGRGTFEEYLVQLLLNKIKLFEMVIGEIDSILSYLEDPTPIEHRISKIILESHNSASLKRRLDRLADEIIKARQQFEKHQEISSRLLDLPAGGTA